MVFSISVQMTGYQFLEVFKGFGRREPDSYQAHNNTKPAEFQRVLSAFMVAVIMSASSKLSLIYSLKNIDD